VDDRIAKFNWLRQKCSPFLILTSQFFNDDWGKKENKKRDGPLLGDQRDPLLVPARLEGDKGRWSRPSWICMSLEERSVKAEREGRRGGGVAGRQVLMQST
jgi:hypothetical protein